MKGSLIVIRSHGGVIIGGQGCTPQQIPLTTCAVRGLGQPCKKNFSLPSSLKPSLLQARRIPPQCYLPKRKEPNFSDVIIIPDPSNPKSYKRTKKLRDYQGDFGVFHQSVKKSTPFFSFVTLMDNNGFNPCPLVQLKKIK